MNASTIRNTIKLPNAFSDVFAIHPLSAAADSVTMIIASPPHDW